MLYIVAFWCLHQKQSCDLFFVEGFQWHLPQIFSRWVGKAEKIFRVRVQRSRLLVLHLWELCEFDISLVIRGILMKLGTNISYGSLKNWNGCQGQSSRCQPFCEHDISVLSGGISVKVLSLHQWKELKWMSQPYVKVQGHQQSLCSSKHC